MPNRDLQELLERMSKDPLSGHERSGLASEGQGSLDYSPATDISEEESKDAFLRKRLQERMASESPEAGLIEESPREGKFYPGSQEGPAENEKLENIAQLIRSRKGRLLGGDPEEYERMLQNVETSTPEEEMRIQALQRLLNGDERN
jgi:hypothetical protein